MRLKRHFTERESPSVDPASCRPQCPPPPPPLFTRGFQKPWASCVEFWVKICVQRSSDLWEAKRRPVFVLSESSAGSSKKRSRTSFARRERGGGGWWLWHLVCLDKVLLMASTVGWQFRRVVLSHLCFEGKTWSQRDSLHFQKKSKLTEREKKQGGGCVNSLQRGSKMTGLVTLFFV